MSLERFNIVNDFTPEEEAQVREARGFDAPKVKKSITMFCLFFFLFFFFLLLSFLFLLLFVLLAVYGLGLFFLLGGGRVRVWGVLR